MARIRPLPHRAAQDGKGPRNFASTPSLNDNTTDASEVPLMPLLKTSTQSFQTSATASTSYAVAEDRAGRAMESATESKASDEGSSPARTEVNGTEKDPGEEVEAPPPARPAGPAAPPPPVDGGLICWLQVVGAFGIWLNSWGLINAYGVFQTYYELQLFRDQESPSNISWIGSIQAFLLLFMGALSGPAFDAGYFKHLVIGGNLLIVFGLMMTSICKEYWQFVLAQGIVCGIGFGMLFAPSIAIIPQYFVKRKAIAGGIAAAGSGVGGVIFPIMLHRLTIQIGFGWAVRVIAFIVFFVGAISALTMRNKLPSGKMRKLYDSSFFHNPPILWYTAGAFFIMMGLYIPIYYIGTYAVVLEITGQNLAFYLLPILMASSAVGRIIPNFFADMTGIINMLVPTTIITCILAYAWTGIKNEAGLIVFAVLYGSCSGLILSLMPTAFPTLVEDKRKIGTNLGMAFMIDSIGVLIGTPISGAILRGTHHFLGLQAFCGSIILVSAILMGIARVSKVGFGLTRI